MEEIIDKFKRQKLSICLRKIDLPFLDILEQIFGDITWGGTAGTINSSFTGDLLLIQQTIYLVCYPDNELRWSGHGYPDKETVYASDLINSINKITFEVSEKEIENLILT